MLLKSNALLNSVTKKFLALIILTLAFGIQAAYAWNFTVPATEVKPANAMFAFPESAFQDGKAKYFQYNVSPNLAIRFFIVKSLDGKMRAAFDACDVCFHEKKGYLQQGPNMVCINCGLKFKTDKINEVRGGGCSPHPLKMNLQNGQILVSVQDVMSGSRFFQ